MRFREAGDMADVWASSRRLTRESDGNDHDAKPGQIRELIRSETTAITRENQHMRSKHHPHGS